MLLVSVAQAQSPDPDPETAASGMQFDSNFLHHIDGQPKADLSVFSQSNRVLPGMHSVFVRLNEQPLGIRELDFVKAAGKFDAQPCMTPAFLHELGVKTEAFPAFRNIDPQDCLSGLNALPNAFTRYDHSKNILNVSIPQAALDNKARGYIPPDMWDDGATAFWSAYRLSMNRTHYSFGDQKQSSDTRFASLRSGLNVGAWRVRVNGNYYDSGGRAEWDWGDRYLERSINPWRGVLRMGDAYTSGDIFTGLRLRGLQLRSDEGMLPDSQRGYAPVIRGIASGYAKVTVRQRGNVIYSTFVPAGPFVINDLYSTPGAGDLEVEVQEIGGKTTRFMQPFAALPMLMREGIWKYNAALGEYRHNYGSSKPWLGQATAAYGLPYGLTAYGGAMVAQHKFQSLALGAGWNLEYLGALSLDVIGSRSESDKGKRDSGHAAHLQYAKSFAGSGTDFTLAGYRYSSSGFRSLDDVVRERASLSQTQYAYNRQHEYQLSLAQRVGTVSSISLNYFGVTYRNAPRNSAYMQLGFNSSAGFIGYSVNYSLSKGPWGATDRMLMVTFSIPLGARQTASYTLNHSNHNGTSNDVALSGPLNDDYSLTYAVQTGVTSGSGDNNGNHGYGSLGYQSPVGTVNLSHAYDQSNRSTTLDVSGAMVIDARGPLFGQDIGETAVIIDAPGAGGVEVNNYPGVRTNAQGRALVPYATPYRENRMLLTAAEEDMEATLKDNIKSVVPTRGAIVVAKFDTDVGRARLISLRDPQGDILPFGASVYDTDGEQRGIVGPVGRVWLTGLRTDVHLVVKWGERQQHRCTVVVDDAVVQDKADAAPRELVCQH
ncbi:fimbria/pilus outer membrane usher protein [Bordetella genomosp. 12]|nr:fimbria/pilus outer membrane usher protein [Bordetella genomosp. 12]